MSDDANVKNGVISALIAYTVWGIFPLMFRALEAVPSSMIVAHRIFWGLMFVCLVLWMRGRLAEMFDALRDRSKLKRIFAATIFLSLNWLIYVWAVEAEEVLAASFGYFINPLVYVFLGMVFLGERQNRMQWIAIAIAAIGVAVQAWSIGGLPWISLGVAITFGIYGYIRKTVDVKATPGLGAETMVMTPFALIFIVYHFFAHGGDIYNSAWNVGWLIFTGPATAAALIFFAAGARQLRLTTMGMFQYIAPSLQFLIAIFIFNEDLNPERLISFALIWLSLIVFTYDSFARARAPKMEVANG